MIKKIFWVLVFLFLVFGFGITVENKIKGYLTTAKIESNPTPRLGNRVPPLDNGGRELVKVMRVIDGDTIELEDKRRVRYIGINAPEMTDKRPAVLALAQKAKAENAKLVEGKTIEMEKDVSETDKYGRLLRYIYVDREMVNLKLVQSGFAAVATYPPDVKYKDLFVKASKTN